MLDEHSYLIKVVAIILVLVTPRIWFSVCKQNLISKWERWTQDLDPCHDYGGRIR